MCTHRTPRNQNLHSNLYPDAVYERYGFNLEDEIVLMACNQSGHHYPFQGFIDA